MYTALVKTGDRNDLIYTLVRNIWLTELLGLQWLPNMTTTYGNRMWLPHMATTVAGQLHTSRLVAILEDRGADTVRYVALLACNIAVRLSDCPNVFDTVLLIVQRSFQTLLNKR